MIEITFKLFGALRKYEPIETKITVTTAEPINVLQVKDRLTHQLKELFPDFTDSSLISDCAIATEQSVLDTQYCVKQSCTLLVLPPVCGG